MDVSESVYVFVYDSAYALLTPRDEAFFFCIMCVREGQERKKIRQIGRQTDRQTDRETKTDRE